MDHAIKLSPALAVVFWIERTRLAHREAALDRQRVAGVAAKLLEEEHDP